MNFLFLISCSWLLVGLLTSDSGILRVKHQTENRLGFGSKNVPSDLVSNSSDMINESAVIDIVGRIKTISSRILNTTQKRRQSLLDEQESDMTPEFQLIFLDKKVTSMLIYYIKHYYLCFKCYFQVSSNQDANQDCNTG